jgi:hypothetical protein
MLNLLYDNKLKNICRFICLCLYILINMNMNNNKSSKKCNIYMNIPTI